MKKTFLKKNNIQQLKDKINALTKTVSKLNKSEQLLTHAVDYAPIGMVTLTIKGKFKTVNKAFSKITGYTEKELLTMNISQITHPDDEHIGYDVIEELTSCKANEAYFEKRYIHKKGYAIYAQVSTVILRDELGAPQNFFTQVIDRTAKKKYQESIIKSEQKYKALVESANDGIIVIQNDVIKFANQKTSELYGASLGNIIGQPFLKFVHTDNIEMIKRRYTDWRTGKKVPNEFEVELINSNTEKRVCEIRSSTTTFEDQPAELVIIHDITEQKYMVTELMEREEKYRTLTQNLNVGVYRNTPGINGRFLEANLAFLKIFGFNSKSELARWKVVDLYPDPKERKRVEEKLASKGFLLNEEIKLRKKDGTIFVASISATSAKDELGKVIHYDGIIEDITERKAMMERIIQERDRSQLYLDIAGVIFLALDRNGNIILANQKTCEILGTTEENLIDKNWFDNHIPKDIRLDVKNVFNKIMNGKEGLVEFYENEILTTAGEKRLIAWHNSTLKDESGKIFGVISSGLDVTEENKARENILAYQSKLKSLTNELIVTEERTRRRLAMTLHDKLGQALILANFKADELKKQTKNAKHKKILNEITSFITEAVNESRNITYELSPPILYERGLVPAISWKLEDIEKSNKIKTSLTDQSKSYEPGKREQIIIYRSINELLQNVLKHSKAESVKVSFRLLKNDYRITVGDDGIGFNLEVMQDKAVSQKKFGLFSIMERIRYIGGRIEIDTVPNKGTKVIINVPIKN